MTKTLAVLIVEDLESDAQLIVRLLTKADYTVAFERVETAEQMRAALEKQTWEIVISDYSLPELDGPTALKLLQETGLDLPFIVVSGTMGEETAVAMMKAGADDYVMKGNLPRLVPAVERELKQAEVRRERKQAEAALRESEEKFHKALEFTPTPIAVAKSNGDLIYLNKHFIEAYGYTLQDLPTIEKWFVLAYPDIEYRNFVLNDWGKRVEDALKNNVATIPAEYLATCKNGEVKTVEISAYFEKDYSVGLFQDITGRKQAEAALRESEEKYKSLHESAGMGIGYYSLDGKVISYNLLAARHMGGNPEEFTGKSVYELFPSSEAEVYMVRIRKAAASNEPQEYEDKVELPGGVKWFVSVFTRILNSSNQVIGVQIISSDISKNKQAEEALQQKNDELERFQRLTIGREVRMIELKKEVNQLLQQAGQQEKYRIVNEK